MELEFIYWVFGEADLHLEGGVASNGGFFQADRVLAVKVRGVNDGFVWVFGNVYGPNVQLERGDFLDLLSNLKFLWPVPWILGGDFNMVRFPYEKKGGISTSCSMVLFSNFINVNELIDLPCHGNRYAWSSNRQQSAMSTNVGLTCFYCQRSGMTILWVLFRSLYRG